MSSDRCFLAYSYNESTRITTALILRPSQAETTDIQNALFHQRSRLGQEYFLPTVFVDVSLDGCGKLLALIKERVLAVEHSTDQHTYQGESAIEHLADDLELSKRAHGLKIAIAVANRRIEVVSLWTNLLLEKFGTESVRTPKDIYVANSPSTRQCIEALEAQVKMERLDLDFLDRRVACQVAAVSLQPQIII